jgi:hypothetical protein
MKRSRFTEEQNIGILKSTRRALRSPICAAWREQCEHLQVEGQVWRHAASSGSRRSEHLREWSPGEGPLGDGSRSRNTSWLSARGLPSFTTFSRRYLQSVWDSGLRSICPFGKVNQLLEPLGA